MEAVQMMERLRAMPELQEVPNEELEWLATRGRLAVFEPGVMYAPGDEARDLIIIFSGHIAVRLDRGLGPRKVAEWTDGQITGRLPFSRMEKVETTILADVRTEAFALDQSHFPDLVHRCPHFTALTVHNMIDRTRGFRTSDLQDEKMMSLGRLAAGLAHELNNPASVMARGAKQLRAALADAERASRGLYRAGLSERQVEAIESASCTWPERPGSTTSLDEDRAIARWLAARHLDTDESSNLSDAGLTVGQLQELADLVPEESLPAALDWLVADRAARSTASDIEKAAKRISDLVEAMKRFTNLDRVSGAEAVDVASGLRDTVRIMAPRGLQKDATLTLDVEPDVPTVHAVASELNQVWTNLIENAFDAVGHAGHVQVRLGKELDQVVVRVTDDGPGIKPEIMSRIFDPFFTTKPPGQGVGLGLEIARQLLRRYRGEISVRSEPGRTEFSTRLPAHSPAEASGAAS